MLSEIADRRLPEALVRLGVSEFARRAHELTTIVLRTTKNNICCSVFVLSKISRFVSAGLRLAYKSNTTSRKYGVPFSVVELRPDESAGILDKILQLIVKQKF